MRAKTGLIWQRKETVGAEIQKKKDDVRAMTDRGSRPVKVLCQKSLVRRMWPGNGYWSSPAIQPKSVLALIRIWPAQPIVDPQFLQGPLLVGSVSRRGDALRIASCQDLLALRPPVQLSKPKSPTSQLQGISSSQVPRVQTPTTPLRLRIGAAAAPPPSMTRSRPTTIHLTPCLASRHRHPK